MSPPSDPLNPRAASTDTAGPVWPTTPEPTAGARRSVAFGEQGLIGRDHLLATLLGDVSRTSRSHGGLVLITGEAGIGKSALLSEVVHEAGDMGLAGAVGTCWNAKGAPGYWPWVQIARSLRSQVPAELWSVAEASSGSPLSAMAVGEGLDAGFDLFDAVHRSLTTLAAEKPLVLAVEDLQWADPDSLRLLEFLAQHAWYQRILLIGTYRDVEVEGGRHPLEAALSGLAARGSVLPLSGLSRQGVGELVERVVGSPVCSSEVTDYHRRTGGNPFFVEQTAQLRNGTGALGSLPAGVREVIRRRIGTLPAEVGEVLGVASVLGRRFDWHILAAVSGHPSATTAALLEVAEATGLVTPDADGRREFTHDLVRQALYDDLGRDRSVDLHAEVVLRAERDPTLSHYLLPGELAGHAFAAGPRLEPDLVVGLLRRAGSDAARRLAVREATTHFRRALEVAAAIGPRRQAEIALELGEELLQGGETGESEDLLRLALTLAKDLNDPPLAARVALVLHRVTSVGGSGTLAAEAMRVAHRRLFGSDGLDGDESAERVAVEAARLARAEGDAESLVFSLWAHHDVLWGPGTAARRQALIEEIHTVSRDRGDRETELFAISLKWVAMFEQGDPSYLGVFRDFVSQMERESTPRAVFSASLDRCIVAVLTGDFANAHHLLERAAAAAGDEPQAYYATMISHLQWSLLLLEGNFDELWEFHEDLDESGYPFPRLLTALSRAQYGELTEASSLAEVWSVQSLPRHYHALWLRLTSQLAVASGDEEALDEALAALTPYSGEWVVSVFGCDISGPMDLWIGIVEAARGDVDSALDRLASAEASARAVQARPWVIQIRWHRARILLRRGSPPDLVAVREQLREVNDSAGALGMHQVAAAARRLLVRINGSVACDASATEDATLTPPSDIPRGAPTQRTTADSVRLQREGKVWALEYQGRTAHMSDTKGLRDLHQLLLQPGQQISSVLLYAPDAGDVARAVRAFGSDPVLDEQAKAQYRRRIEALDEQIDRTLQFERDEEAAELDREREALLEELRSATGLGGRSRKLDDASDRARKAVTARIKDTLRKMQEVHPELALLLRDHVSTGASCMFSPVGTVAVWSL